MVERWTQDFQKLGLESGLFDTILLLTSIFGNNVTPYAKPLLWMDLLGWMALWNFEKI